MTSKNTSNNTTQKELEDKLLTAKTWCLKIWALIGGLILVAIVGYILGVLSVAVAIIMWSTIIVFCLRGMVNSLEKKGINRLLGTTLSFIFTIILLIAIVFLVFSPALGLGAQFADFMNQVPYYVSKIVEWVNGLYQQYAELLNVSAVQNWINNALAAISDQASIIAQSSANGVVAFGTAIVNMGMILAFAFVISFWILIDLPKLGKEFRKLFNKKYQEDLDVLHVTLTRVMGGYIKATLIQCALVGILSGIWFGIMGVPNAAALGCITGILNIIPVVGPWIGGIIAAIIMVFISPIKALIVFIGAFAAQQFVYTFISPRIMRDSVDVHPAFTFIALMVGSAVGGLMGGLIGSIVGMLISIPITAVTKSLFVYYFEKRTGRQLVSEEGVFFKGSPKSLEETNPFGDAIAPHPKSVSTHDQDAALKKRLMKNKTTSSSEKKDATTGKNPPVSPEKTLEGPPEPTAFLEASADKPDQPLVTSTTTDSTETKKPASEQK